MNEKAMEKWNETWSADTHTTEHASKRIKSAKSAKLTPLNIDEENLLGNFKGSSGRYETHLDTCQCVDFIRNKLPCKHMYRLAIELGVLNEKADSNIHLIPQAKNEKTTLSATVDIIEKLSKEAQKRLCTIAYSTTDAKPIAIVEADTIIEELLGSGILVDDGAGVQEKVTFGKKTETIDFLTSHNVSFSKSAKKSVLENLCLSELPEETKGYFGVIPFYKVLIPNRFNRRNIHYYLHRKHDYSEYIDENGGLVPLLKTWLPDDKVTDELIKRGYYSRDGIANPEEGIEISITGGKDW